MAANERAGRAGPAARRGEQGSILLVSLLVLLVLTGVALIVVQNVSMELANVGTFRVAKQGYYLTEAGLAGPLMLASQDQNLFLGGLEKNNFKVYMTDIDNNFFDFDTWGSFGPQFADPEAAAFVTYFHDPVDTKRVPGFSTVGFCYRKYTVTADGYLGKSAVKNTETSANIEHTALARFVSHVYMGPFQCGY